MSFTTEIKRELTKTLPEGRECRFTLLQAFFKTCGWRTEEGLFFVSENESVAAYILDVAESCRFRMSLREAVRDPKHGRDKLTFSHTGEDGADVEEIFAQDVDTEERARAFLKGAFLGGGSCILPHGERRTGYHLELVFPALADAELCGELFERFLLLGGMVERADKHVVYSKSREGIGDFLSVVGAQRALRTLTLTAAARDESNNRNRLENCMAGNVDRSMTASALQIRYLSSLRESELILLPEPLRETAEARIQNPTLTYSELAGLLGISKSCLQRRLKKLIPQGEKK